MRLISLHVENFGTLKDFTYIFRDGINTVIHENGWGKSTLAAFIRIMFYGFDNETKRSELENERKRFYPWEGGTFGGMIVFEAKEKTYRIERTFDEKKGGTFALIDARTNLRSGDFTENIGEELFGIDAQSFERTVFIGQQDCQTRATSAINAKIGNLADNTADMGQYEEVQARLKKEADSLTPYRKTGAIARLKDDIAAREAKTGSRERKMRRRDETAGRILNLRNLRNDNTNRLKDIREDMKKLSVIRDRSEKKSEFDRLKNNLAGAEERLKNARDFFGQREPDEDELREMTAKASELSNLDQIMKDFRLSENEKREEERIYDEYPEGFPEDEEVSRLLSLCSESSAKRNALVSKKANLRLMRDLKDRERAEAAEKNRKSLFLGLVFLGFALVLAALGAVLMSSSRILSYVLIALGLAGAFFGIFKLSDRKKVSEGEGADETLSELEEDIQKDTGFIEKTDEAVSLFLKKLSLARPEDGDIGPLFERVREDKRRSADYSARRERFDDAHRQREALSKEINAFLVSCGREESTDPGDALSDIKDRLRELKADERAVIQSREALGEFEAENDTQILEQEIETPKHTLEELNSRLENLTNENEELLDKIKQYEEELEDIEEELSDLDENDEALEELKERLDELQYRYGIICDTGEYLERAKNSFSSRYMEPIKEAFDKYYSVLSCDDGKEYELDANLNIKLKDRGVRHDTELLSDGYRDLVGLCRRMAMIEAMYREETPFLILDDPFVNLDNDRVRGGINILKRISENYQIIYFTCHDSRAV